MKDSELDTIYTAANIYKKRDRTEQQSVPQCFDVLWLFLALFFYSFLNFQTIDV
jgi:hypothetical protein